MKRWIPIFGLFLLGAILLPAEALAQGVTTATVRGQVVDRDGQPLPGANVISIHQPSGTKYGASTDANGRFTIPNVRVGGPYQITASFVGYQSQREAGLRLELGETRRLQFTLREQTAELSGVEVIAERGAVFDQERTGISNNISEEEIDAAPTLDRSIADFARLTPQAYVANDDDDGAAISIAGQNNRYNSIFIDGAVSNDVFGLAATGTDGGQAGATPISIGAIEQFEVDISPFDVTQSFFAGGAINAVTRSGTNEYRGSFFYERRGDEVGGIGFAESLPGEEAFPEFSDDRYIVNVSGPIIKDKLFFFANADIRRSSSPQPFADGGFSGYRGANINSQSDVDEFVSFVEETLDFNPGSFQGNASTVDSDKFFGKLDWNINENHRLSARYNYSQTDNIDAFGSDNNSLNFSSRFEVFPNTTQVGALELNSTFGNRFANKLILSYKNVEDDRGTNVSTPFPTINVDDGPAEIQFGAEPFSTTNLLEQEVFTLTNNFNVYLGDHTLTVGTHNEFYDLNNKFAPFNFGWYFYNSVEDFRQSACAATENPGSISGCSQFGPNPDPANVFVLRGFSLRADDPNTPEFEENIGDNADITGQFNSIIVGGYIQDEWQVSDRLRVTAGLRIDVPKVLDDPPFADPSEAVVPDDPAINPLNSTIPAISRYYRMDGVAPGQVPDANLHWAPRLGFNFDAFGDQRTQVRGGLGVYTSRQPFVWFGGMFLNNGTNTGEVGSFGPNPLRPDPSNGLTVADTDGRDPSSLIPAGRLEMFQQDYLLPRFLRYALGVDQQLPLGFVGTLEGQYTNTLQNITVTNVNLLPANESLDGPDNRPIWAPDQYDRASVAQFSDGQFIDGRYSNIHRVGNTSRGYSYDITARLRKVFEEVGGLRNAIATDVSYTWGESWVVNDATSSQLNSIWDGVEHVNGANNLGLSRSDFSIGHRVLARVNYRQQFGSNFAANLSVIYNGESGRPFSYVIDNSDEMVRENGDTNSLVYVPRNASALTFQDTEIDGLTVTAAQQAAAFEQFISENEYLDQRRGGYAERNADRTPWEGVVDLNLRFEFFGDLIGGRQQKLEVIANIFNFSSMLGEIVGQDSWGDRFAGNSQFRPIQFEGFADEDGGDFTPVYTAEIVEVTDVNGDGTADRFDGAISQDDINSRIITGSTYSSQWQLKLGVRLGF